MSSPETFSVLDLLDLTPVERTVFIEIARHGPLSVEKISAALSLPESEINVALDALRARNRIRRLSDDTYDVVMGKTKPHTTLPAQLWPAVLAPQRLYSEQEIAILKVAIPMLQFVRATLSSFADHGPHHALRVKTFATQLGYVLGLTDTERRLLRVGALFHDVGNVVEREHHHQISQQTVEQLVELGKLPLTEQEVRVTGLLCRWHRKEYEPERIDNMRGEAVRTGLAASILRVADAMDIDSRRSDYDREFRFAMEFFFPEKRQYFTSLEEVYGVRVVCQSDVNVQVFTRGVVRENIQIEQLHFDLSKTPLPWNIVEIPIPSAHNIASDAINARAQNRRALVAFPFDAHSLVMAALSRKHLERAGMTVDILCYPDTPDGTPWLWQNALRETDAAEFSQLVVIGDRPAENSTPYVLETIAQWKNAGAQIHLLNRYEANWARIPELRARGIVSTLGTDWAYFWGDDFSPDDFEWANLAAFMTRDPTMASSAASLESMHVMQGVLCAVLDAEQQRARDTNEWRALAEPLLERIAKNDRAHFAARAQEFVTRYAAPARPFRVEGRVLIFDDAPGAIPQSFFWILEAAMEQQGFIYERELRLRVPYAIAAYADGDAVEIIAMNHWRANHVPPIRLLYPELGPRPQGTENTLTVRVPRELAFVIVPRLVQACNQK